MGGLFSAQPSPRWRTLPVLLRQDEGRVVTRLDRYGDPIEDDGNLAPVVSIRPRQSVKAHIAELRRILRESRERREDQS
jgi:hypothetical protein